MNTVEHLADTEPDISTNTLNCALAFHWNWRHLIAAVNTLKQKRIWELHFSRVTPPLLVRVAVLCVSPGLHPIKELTV